MENKHSGKRSGAELLLLFPSGEKKKKNVANVSSVDQRDERFTFVYIYVTVRDTFYSSVPMFLPVVSLLFFSAASRRIRNNESFRVK